MWPSFPFVGNRSHAYAVHSAYRYVSLDFIKTFVFFSKQLFSKFWTNFSLSIFTNFFRGSSLCFTSLYLSFQFLFVMCRLEKIDNPQCLGVFLQTLIHNASPLSIWFGWCLICIVWSKNSTISHLFPCMDKNIYLDPAKEIRRTKTIKSATRENPVHCTLDEIFFKKFFSHRFTWLSFCTYDQHFHLVFKYISMENEKENPISLYSSLNTKRFLF